MRELNIIKTLTSAVKGWRFVWSAFVIVVLSTFVAHAEVISEWHREAARLSTLPASNLAPVQQNRAMAIVQVAVNDAVNGYTAQYETYLPRVITYERISPDAAAVAAAYHALRTLFPSHSASLDNLFLSSLAAHGLSVNDPGVAYGIAAATRILAARANDGAAQSQFNYTAPGAGLPGVWVPLTAQPALLPGWGDLTPFVLHSSDQFLPEPPPALGSEQYARDYNEIKEIGAINSPTRSTLQTQIATFWLGSPVAIWSQPLEQLSASRNLSLSQRARIFALVYLASSDASVACWEAKYHYNFWRPEPAIRRGAEDGNSATAADLTWTPLFPTPRHPEYPSGHSTGSTATATILQQFFGDDPGMPITSTITGITREWETISEGVNEVIEARIYSGIHFRTADEVGSMLGWQVAQYVSANALRPCLRRGSRC